MEGSETGCGRVWTVVRMEDGGSETGCGRVWTGVSGGTETGRGRGEKLRKLRLKQLQMKMIVGESGVDVGGQRPCTKHVSGLVSNMLQNSGNGG